jgi:hypothetical protein
MVCALAVIQWPLKEGKNMAYKGPLDYIDVATRIIEFREKYPTGSLQPWRDPYVIEVNVGDGKLKSFMVYSAAAYRSPDDTLPGVGYAWEPIPGPTSFTRDSELQNAETAAWGRAMVAALAVDTRKGIASSEEVRNRQGETAPAVKAPVQEARVYTDEEVATASEWIDKVAEIDDIEELKKVWAKQSAFLDVPVGKDTLKAAINRRVAAGKQ